MAKCWIHDRSVLCQTNCHTHSSLLHAWQHATCWAVCCVSGTVVCRVYGRILHKQQSAVCVPVSHTQGCLFMSMAVCCMHVMSVCQIARQSVVCMAFCCMHGSCSPGSLLHAWQSVNAKQSLVSMAICCMDGSLWHARQSVAHTTAVSLYRISPCTDCHEQAVPWPWLVSSEFWVAQELCSLKGIDVRPPHS